MRRREWMLGLLTFALTGARWAVQCVKDGAHWTFGEAGHWRRIEIKTARAHLFGTHGHPLDEVKNWSKIQILAMHDAHHQGGKVTIDGKTYVVPKPVGRIHP